MLSKVGLEHEDVNVPVSSLGVGKQQLIESRCCGIGGTYGFKKENYDVSQSIGAPLFKQIGEVDPEVVARLRLYMSYTVDGTFHRNVLYGTSLPISADLLDVDENVGAGFTVSENGGRVTLNDFIHKNEKVGGKPVVGHYGDTLQTPVGRIIVQKTKDYSGEAMKKPVNVRKSGQRGVTQSYLNRLQVNLADKNADVISLSIKDVSTQRAQDILNTLIAVYNENWVRDKNQIANSTSVFINDRLRVIEGELAGVDSDISAYKSENMIPDVGAAATMYMQQSTVLNQQLQDVSNQLYMARYIKDYIGKEDNRNQPLPANMGLSSQTIENGISEYNSKILQRNNLVANSGEENVLVKDLDQALASMRGSISRSIDNEILALNTKYENLKGTARQNTARIAANPNQAKQTARLDDTNDLPAPGLNDVTAMTLLPGSRIMNSKLVRSTLNASLTTLRLP